MAQKQLFFIEVTDVYGGEANYSWVTRHVVRAKSFLGAIQWLSRNSGLNWRFDGMRYNSASGSTCAFIDYFDESIIGGDDEEIGGYALRLDTDQR